MTAHTGPGASRGRECPPAPIARLAQGPERRRPTRGSTRGGVEEQDRVDAQKANDECEKDDPATKCGD